MRKQEEDLPMKNGPAAKWILINSDSSWVSPLRNKNLSTWMFYNHKIWIRIL